MDLERVPEIYTNDRLKDLLKKAWEFEVAEKGKELGRELTEEEKKEIKITKEFLDRYQKKGCSHLEARFFVVLEVLLMLQIYLNCRLLVIKHVNLIMKAI